VASRKKFDPKVKRHPHVTVAFDGTPVFRGLAHVLHKVREDGWKGRLDSGDRRKGVAERYGKLSQFVLYVRWLARWRGYNPANPPGRSTHELHSDGVPYRGPIGRPLHWWQLGLDVTYAEQLVAILAHRGYRAFQPYRDGRERHHVNFRRNPWPRWRRKHRRK
jgi:hypothetical protein